MRIICRLLLLLFLINSSSCIKAQKEFDNKFALEEYVYDAHGVFSSEKFIDGFKFKFTVKPIELTFFNKLSNSPDPSKFSEIEDKYGDYIYIDLSMSKDDDSFLKSMVRNKAEYERFLDIFSNQMGEYVGLKNCKGERIELLNSSYNRLYGKTNLDHFIFVFHKKKINNCDNFIVHLDEFGLGTGNLSFKFNYKTIRNQNIVVLNNTE